MQLTEKTFDRLGLFETGAKNFKVPESRGLRTGGSGEGCVRKSPARGHRSAKENSLTKYPVVIKNRRILYRGIVRKFQMPRAESGSGLENPDGFKLNGSAAAPGASAMRVHHFQFSPF